MTVAPDMGLRESRHIVAQYRVTSKDVLYGRSFDDCIAKGSYRVDIHEGAGITFRYLNGDEHVMEATPEGNIQWRRGKWRTDAGPYPTWYEIPMRALLPIGAENLCCAGRMVDCEREAYGASAAYRGRRTATGGGILIVLSWWCMGVLVDCAP